jgi:hypothetical protein
MIAWTTGLVELKSGVDAVTLLVFLSRTAGTRLVAADLGLIADDRLHLAVFFASGCRALVWSSKS